MKPKIAVLIVLIGMLATAFTSGLIQKREDNRNSISLDSLEQRVFDKYGEGDAGCEELYYLKTGKHWDYATGYAYSYDYHVNITDSGTLVYNTIGVYATFVPYDSNSLWDRAIKTEDSL